MTTDTEALRAVVERVRAGQAGQGWGALKFGDIDTLCTVALRVAELEGELARLRLVQRDAHALENEIEVWRQRAKRAEARLEHEEELSTVDREGRELDNETLAAERDTARAELAAAREAASANAAVIATLRRRAKGAEDDAVLILKEIREAFAPMQKLYDLLVLSNSESASVPIVTFRRLNEALAALEARAALEGGME